MFYFLFQDFGVSILLALFWFCGSIAWASALSGLKDKTNVETVITGKVFPICSAGASCSVLKHATYGSANVSVVSLMKWTKQICFTVHCMCTQQPLYFLQTFVQIYILLLHTVRQFY